MFLFSAARNLADSEKFWFVFVKLFWRIYGGFFKDLWRIFERYFQEVFDGFLKGFFKDFSKDFEGIFKRTFERFLKDLWRIFWKMIERLRRDFWRIFWRIMRKQSEKNWYFQNPPGSNSFDRISHGISYRTSHRISQRILPIGMVAIDLKIQSHLARFCKILQDSARSCKILENSLRTGSRHGSIYRITRSGRFYFLVNFYDSLEIIFGRRTEQTSMQATNDPAGFLVKLP